MEVRARWVRSDDGRRIATYEVGPLAPARGAAPRPDRWLSQVPVVLTVHGFASSFDDNFVRTGWVRELLRSGMRVLGVDQRGHGSSDKPRQREAYSTDLMVDDLRVVLDAYDVARAHYIGYSLGARVGWRAALDMPDRLRRVVLGGIPDGAPLRRFQLEAARYAVATGEPAGDPVTAGYLSMVGASSRNDVRALLAMVEGLRGGGPDEEPNARDVPRTPVLFATGGLDGVIEGSRRLARATPGGQFFEIPGRHHFNAPTSRAFKETAIAFLLQTT